MCVALELVRYAWAEVELDGHAGSAESLGVGKVLVAEDVELADLDVTGGQTGKVDGAAVALLGLSWCAPLSRSRADSPEAFRSLRDLY